MTALLLRPPPLSKLGALDALRAIQFTDREYAVSSAPGNLLPGLHWRNNNCQLLVI